MKKDMQGQVPKLEQGVMEQFALVLALAIKTQRAVELVLVADKSGRFRRFSVEATEVPEENPAQETLFPSQVAHD